MARSQKRREQCFLSSPRNPLQTLVNKPSHTFLSTYSHSQTEIHCFLEPESGFLLCPIHAASGSATVYSRSSCIF
ncbi:hypothetical protein CK203_050173 [Vitis vinifera]|uniref:Uncharacterized protein n=1 Tax=Vitis vinifera TaxID=29760 RepID=A0A438G0G2_VITVI|nr:hypothetical protein CK203_050173 [Vitis vinifera]